MCNNLAIQKKSQLIRPLVIAVILCTGMQHRANLLQDLLTLSF